MKRACILLGPRNLKKSYIRKGKDSGQLIFYQICTGPGSSRRKMGQTWPMSKQNVTGGDGHEDNICDLQRRYRYSSQNSTELKNVSNIQLPLEFIYDKAIQLQTVPSKIWTINLTELYIFLSPQNTRHTLSIAHGSLCIYVLEHSPLRVKNSLDGSQPLFCCCCFDMS